MTEVLPLLTSRQQINPPVPLSYLRTVRLVCARIPPTCSIIIVFPPLSAGLPRLDRIVLPRHTCGNQAAQRYRTTSPMTGDCAETKTDCCRRTGIGARCVDPDRRRKTARKQCSARSAGPRPPGCRFHSRCPQVMVVCQTTPPPLIDIAPGKAPHQVRCHPYLNR